MLGDKFDKVKEIITLSFVEDLLVKLISIKSFSGEEFDILRFIEKYARGMKINYSKQYVSDRRYNLILKSNNSSKKDILLNTHLDTVPTFLEQQLRPYKKGDKIYGRGACDAKGSVTVMLITFLALHKLKMLKKRHVTLALMVGEENSGDGVATFIKNNCNYSLAIIGEPTGMKVASSQAGYLEFTIIAKSIPSHAFDPIGEQAIITMTDAINKINELIKKYFKSSNVFVRYIRGGNEDTYWYTRDICKSTLLINTYPDSQIKRLKEKISELISKLNKNTKHVKISVHMEDWDNGITLKKDLRDLKKLKKSFGEMKIPFGFMHLPSWTDGSTIASKKIPTFIFGPGFLKNAHTKFEHININDVRDSALLLANFLIKLQD